MTTNNLQTQMNWMCVCVSFLQSVPERYKSVQVRGQMRKSAQLGLMNSQGVIDWCTLGDWSGILAKRSSVPLPSHTADLPPSARTLPPNSSTLQEQRSAKLITMQKASIITSPTIPGAVGSSQQPRHRHAIASPTPAFASRRCSRAVR